MTHDEAVELLKFSSVLRLRFRSVGKVPHSTGNGNGNSSHSSHSSNSTVASMWSPHSKANNDVWSTSKVNNEVNQQEENVRLAKESRRLRRLARRRSNEIMNEEDRDFLDQVENE